MTGPLLVILPHNPGDVVMALQALSLLRPAFPGLAVDYVVSEECRALAEGSPLLRKVHVLPRRALREAAASGQADALLAGLEDFLAGLGRAGCVASLNLFQERYGALLQGLVPVERKSGLELSEGSLLRVAGRLPQHLFAIPAARRDNGWHAVDIYLRCARELLDPGGRAPWPESPSADPVLPPSRPPAAWDGPAAGGYLAFHPGSAWPGKRWPEARWAALAAACAREGQPVVLTGSEEERPAIARILSALPAEARPLVHDWAGRTDLPGAAWIHGHARMTVTGDTVAMHLAAAAGTPTLGLFGPSNPVETGPYGPGHFVLQTEVDLPADLRFDREHPGLAGLSAEAVAAFLLRGEAPAGVCLWETAWDARRRAQVLRDRKGGLHPHQDRTRSLRDLLDGRTAVTPPREPAPGDPRRAVLDALARARGAIPAGRPVVAAPDTLHALHALERADGELAHATRDSAVWEAYRIGINGVPLRDIRAHLAERARRLEQALREESALPA